jgi:hypothetical protein
MLALRSAFRRPFKRNHQRDLHILLVGTTASSVSGVESLCQEMFHPDRGSITQRITIVILAPCEPGVRLQMLMKTLSFGSRIFYVNGSCFREEDLLLARADTADACFVLCDKYSNHSGQEDKLSAMRALLVEDFNPQLETFVQVTSSSSQRMLKGSAVNHLFCVDDIHQAILAKSILCPGFSTLFGNLVCSVTKPTNGHQQMRPWETEYNDGCQLEVYVKEIFV